MWILHSFKKKTIILKIMHDYIRNFKRGCWLWIVPINASLVSQMVKNPPARWETWVLSLGWEVSLEEGMATHFSSLAWRIPMVRGTWEVTANLGIAIVQESDPTEWLTTHTQWAINPRANLYESEAVKDLI